MGPATNRRDFLGILLGGAPAFAFSFGGAGLPELARVFGQRPTSFTATPLIPASSLSDNLIHFSGAGGNVVVVTGPDGLVMVNGGREEMCADLLKAVTERTGGKRVQSLFDTD